MQSVNKLGLIVVVVTGLVLGVVYAGYQGVRYVYQKSTATPTPSPVARATPNPVANDSDHDGLPDVVESLYKTDPAKADSDNDGTSDGAEVLAGRDPALPGPKDLLVDSVTQKPIDNTNTYTGRYLAALPSDLPKADVLSKDRVTAFIEQEKGSLLPEIATATIITTDKTGQDAIKNYLDSISAVSNPKLKAVTSEDIEKAFQAAYADPTQSKALEDILTSLNQNLILLKAVPAPAEVVALHQKLLSASQALVDNVTLLKGMPNDFVGGLLGAKKIEELGPVFQAIEDEIQKLEGKYSLS